MAISSKVGRPVYEADIDLEHDPNQEIYSQFYKACQSLTCADMRRLARALRVTLATVMRWRVGQRYPMDIGTPILIIQWVQNGKPVRMRTQAEIAASMLSESEN